MAAPRPRDAPVTSAHPMVLSSPCRKRPHLCPYMYIRGRVEHRWDVRTLRIAPAPAEEGGGGAAGAAAVRSAGGDGGDGRVGVQAVQHPAEGVDRDADRGAADG